MPFEQTWRWFGPTDPISLKEIKQTGATGVVTALHHIPVGESWPIDGILERKRLVEAEGLSWSVVESVPVHEDIKRGTGDYRRYVDNCTQTIRNLGACGIDIVCYNFMPVLDWLRTDLHVTYGDGSITTKFEMKALAAFDMFILKRKDAHADYPDAVVREATAYYESMTAGQRDALVRTILLGLPGSLEAYTLEQFRGALGTYAGIRVEETREHLSAFIRHVEPVAQESGVRLAIHPDDPPFPLFGLPRVVGTKEDLEQILAAFDSPANGLAFCAGSLAASEENDVVDMAEEFAARVNFLHLRNVKRDGRGGFTESDHLDGDVNVYAIMEHLLEEQDLRAREGLNSARIPLRADHGHLMHPDFDRKGLYPGYSLFGRMRGLAELRGLEMGIRRSLGLP